MDKCCDRVKYRRSLALVRLCLASRARLLHSLFLSHDRLSFSSPSNAHHHGTNQSSNVFIQILGGKTSSSYGE